jgi:hypothetical protein
MRWMAPAILSLLLVGSPLRAQQSSIPSDSKQDDTRKAELSAAVNDAYDALAQEVLATPVITGVSIQDFARATNSQDQIDQVIHRAERVGGARWLEDQTVQVRLELRGKELVKTLLAIALRNDKALPISVGTLRNRLNNTLYERTFSATGSSTAGSAANRLRPDPSQTNWRNVTDSSRRAAIDTARKNAVDRVVDSLRPIDMGAGQRLDLALQVPAVSAPLRDWLSRRPVRSIQFMDDLGIRLTLSATPRELWPTLRGSLQRQKVVRIPENPAGWDRLWKQVDARMAAPVGTALAQAGAPATVPAVLLPAQPPAWIDGTADAQGQSPPVAGPKLKTALAAEAVALEHLRAKLNALPLNSKTSLGQAARTDPRLNEAMTRALGRARIAKVLYDTPRPGWVTATMSVNLQDLWTMLAGQ